MDGVTVSDLGVDLDAVRSTLTSPLLCDVIDRRGGTPRCLGTDILPLLPESVVAGYAFPVHLEPVTQAPEVPYVGLLAALDAIAPDEVMVLPTGRADHVAVWGELVSTACRARGAAGTVTDGLVRDSREVRRLGYPVFGRGTTPYDINGRLEITAHRVAAVIEDVTIEPGDLIFGDSDGVVVLPWSEAAADVAAALAKRRGELEFRSAVADGMSPIEAYRRFGVL